MNNYSKKDKIILIIMCICLAIVLGIIMYSINIIVYSPNVDVVETIGTANINNSKSNEEKLVIVISEKIEEKPVDDSEISIEDLPQEIVEEPKDNNGKVNSGSPYYIKVNYEANVVTIYTIDSEGEYTIPVRAMICSTGTATPRSGQYKTKGRYRWISLFGNVYGQYSMQIVGNILFHSVPYTENRNPGSLEYWEYDKLGTSASMGCVRLRVVDAKWIYDNIPAGTIVEFYSDSNPGPLGKPSAQKISGNVECRDWDPTDPDSSNPWYNENNWSNEESKELEIERIEDEPSPSPTPIIVTPQVKEEPEISVTLNENTFENSINDIKKDEEDLSDDEIIQEEINIINNIIKNEENKD